jgi:predicted phage terminase large subunit-like protein
MNDDNKDLKLEEMRARCLGSLLDFTRVFYKIRTGRNFIVSQPTARESHHIVIARELTNVFDLKTNRLIINIAPGSGKSELCRHFIAWALAHYPDSNFLYISFSHERASTNTAIIRDIISLPAYKKLFGVSINPDFSARDNFKTTKGGNVIAFGSSGSITGADAGLPNLDRFSGACVMDDMHKPDEVFSDGIREGVIDNFKNTIALRKRGHNVPFIFIGQRLHEDDLPSYLISKDKMPWKTVILKTIDDAGNILYPEVYKREELEGLGDYAFAAQHQQDPIPAGGGIYKPEWLKLMDEEPPIIATFITVDTAETSKTYNDKTVFSFFGLHKLQNDYAEIDDYGLHWLDCLELSVEPADLEAELRAFYTECLRFHVKPSTIAIEKKSAGVTLCSALKRIQGLDITEIERTSASGSKTARFLEIQPYIKKGLISLPRYGRHTKMVIEHMRKITSNNSHRHDDVCLAKGTKISTLFGYKNIEDIRVNDLVITPFGLGRVTGCGLTQYDAEVMRFSDLIGTSNHPIFDGNKFSRMDTLSDASKCDILSFGGILKWQYKKLLYLMESNTELWGREGIILANQQAIKEGEMLKDFMWQFGNFIAVKKYKKALLFITRMVIILIMNIAIWSVFLASNILNCMAKKDQRNNWNIWKRLGSKLKNGIGANKVEHGTEKMRKIILPKSENLFALCVGCSFQQNLPVQNIAVMNVLREMTPEKQETVERQDVYNLTVENYGVYYANNILTSNCDTAYDAIKMALIDKIVAKLYVNTSKLYNQKSVNVLANYMSKLNRVSGEVWRQ